MIACLSCKMWHSCPKTGQAQVVDPITRPWRTGRKVGRNIYAQRGDEPADSDPIIGQLDTPELAAEAVAAHNERLQRAPSSNQPSEPVKPCPYVDIVFDAPPSHESGRFVETESPAGVGVMVGEWIDRGDGYWALRIPRHAQQPSLCCVAAGGLYLLAQCTCGKMGCTDLSHAKRYGCNHLGGPKLVIPVRELVETLRPHQVSEPQCTLGHGPLCPDCGRCITTSEHSPECSRRHPPASEPATCSKHEWELVERCIHCKDEHLYENEITGAPRKRPTPLPAGAAGEECSRCGHNARRMRASDGLCVESGCNCRHAPEAECDECRWQGTMADLNRESDGVTHCPNCGGTAIQERPATPTGSAAEVRECCGDQNGSGHNPDAGEDCHPCDCDCHTTGSAAEDMTDYAARLTVAVSDTRLEALAVRIQRQMCGYDGERGTIRERQILGILKDHFSKDGELQSRAEQSGNPSSSALASEEEPANNRSERSEDGPEREPVTADSKGQPSADEASRATSGDFHRVADRKLRQDREEARYGMPAIADDSPAMRAARRATDDSKQPCVYCGKDFVPGASHPSTHVCDPESAWDYAWRSGYLAAEVQAQIEKLEP